MGNILLREMVDKKIVIAYFANPNSIHDCKWINFFASKYKVIVFCNEKKDNKPYLWLSSQIKTYSILPLFSALNIIQQVRIKKQLQLIVKAEGVNVLHSMYAVPNAIWANLVQVGNHIMTTRGSDILVDYLKIYHNPQNFQQKISFKIMIDYLENAIKKAKIITSTSTKQKSAIENIVEDNNKLYVIRTGVNIKKFKFSKPRKKELDDYVIFSPRSMKPIYNIELLIRGVADYRKKSVNQKIILKIINDVPNTPYSKKILRLIKNEGYKNFVKVLPRMTQTEMLTEYSNSDLVIMIPTSDGTPVSAIETMIMKKPLILGDLDYDKDLFNKESIWKIKAFSVFEISKTIEAVLSSPSKSNKKVEHAQKLAFEKADLHKSLNQIEQFYQEFANGK